MRHPRGFTLIELVACLAVVALITGAGVLLLRGSERSESLESSVRQLVARDRQLRQRTCRLGRPETMLLDLAAGRIRYGQPDALDQAGAEMALHLPKGVRIEQVWVGNESANYGQVSIACSPLGHTPSYAVQLASSAQRRWLLVAGLTGNVQRFDNAEAVQQILRQAAQAGDDAD